MRFEYLLGKDIADCYNDDNLLHVIIEREYRRKGELRAYEQINTIIATKQLDELIDYIDYTNESIVYMLPVGTLEHFTKKGDRKLVEVAYDNLDE